jgi:hypothetical protein
MKNTYLTISVFTSIFSLSAQVSLTRTSNQPIQGNVNTKQIYDSVGVIPSTTGNNQLWDFSNFAVDSAVEVSNYISVASAPGGSSFTGANLVEAFGSTYFFMKAGYTKYEIVGIRNSNFELNFSSNVATQFIWPVAYGYSKTDAFSGTAVANSMNGNVSGNIYTTALGSGTLIVPGGTIFNNVLQVKVRINASASFLLGLANVNLSAIDYTYYDAVHKFPLVTVSYADVTGDFTSKEAVVKMNSSVVGINDLNFESSFNIFPNPAKSDFTIKLSNQYNYRCTVEIINSTGQTAKTIDLGHAIAISESIKTSDLLPGMYIVKTILGDRISSRKLIIE